MLSHDSSVLKKAVASTPLYVTLLTFVCTYVGVNVYIIPDLFNYIFGCLLVLCDIKQL